MWYAFHWLFKHALATQAASDLRLWSSSLRLPPGVHVNLPWPNLSPLSPSMQRSAVNARGSYIVPGPTLLGAVLIWYTVNRLLQQTLLHKPLPFFGFVFVFLSNMFTVGSSTSATLVLPVYIHTYMYMHIIYIIIYMCVYDYIYTCICIHAWLDRKLHRCRMLDVCPCNLNYPRYHEKEYCKSMTFISSKARFYFDS